MSKTRKNFVIFVSLITLLIPALGSADSQKSISEKSDIGFWTNEDCNKTSEAAGFFLYMSGLLLEATDEKHDSKSEVEELHRELDFAVQQEDYELAAELRDKKFEAEELHRELDFAVQQEDYELAAELRDEIDDLDIDKEDLHDVVMFFSDLSANAASVFETFCKR